MAEFHHFDPRPCGFPVPGAPVLPAWGWADLTPARADAGAAGVLDGPGVRHYSRGRYALHAALQVAGLGPGGVLLVPAYHCVTMVDPALALGASFQCYATGPDLAPDMAQLRGLLEAADGAVRAVLIPHYFGFEQPRQMMAELSALCLRHGATLIEDCSHAWQIAARRAREGIRDGALLVGSPYKFFACEDGGVLWGDPARLAGLAPQPLSWMAELRGLREGWERGRRARRGPASAQSGAAGPQGLHSVVRRGQPSSLYETAMEGRAGLRLSRWIMRRTPVAQVVHRRRRHYAQWLQASLPLKGARALFPALAPDCAPYMFALLLDEPERQFYALKQAGLPIWRWDDMALSDCPVAARYRLGLLHLPCHQGLSGEQMAWMTDTLSKVLA